jgi:Putative undecaprenyl diphosphate synthase
MNASVQSKQPAQPLRAVVSIALDCPAIGARSEEHLGDLVGRLFEGGAGHVTLIGAGPVSPEQWTPARLGKPLRHLRDQDIGSAGRARHYRAGAIGLSLLPAGAGQAIVAEAARRRFCSHGAAQCTIAELDGAIAELSGPAPDLVVLTGGATTLAGSLTWPAAYAELAFFEPSWTTLTADDVARALSELACRGRRFGGLAAMAAP